MPPELGSIIGLTLLVNISSSLIALILGILAGFYIFYTKSPLRSLWVVLNRTLMSLPPVVLGLLLFLLFSRQGPLGPLEMLFTVKILILSQILLVTPIISGHFYDLLEHRGGAIMAYAEALGAGKIHRGLNTLYELKEQLIFVFVVGLSRAVSEVGAVMIVGGNLRNKTRMMTTSISMLQSQGDIREALILGGVLLLLAFIMQYLIYRFKGGEGVSS